MHDQSSGLTVIMGGVDRSAEFRRETRKDRHVIGALLISIGTLLTLIVWLASIALAPQVQAAALAPATTVSRYVDLKPTDPDAPRSPEPYTSSY